MNIMTTLFLVFARVINYHISLFTIICFSSNTQEHKCLCAGWAHLSAVRAMWSGWWTGLWPHGLLHWWIERNRCPAIAEQNELLWGKTELVLDGFLVWTCFGPVWTIGWTTVVKKNFFIKHYTESQSPFDNKALNVYKTDHDLITVCNVTQRRRFLFRSYWTE